MTCYSVGDLEDGGYVDPTIAPGRGGIQFPSKLPAKPLKHRTDLSADSYRHANVRFVLM